MTTLTQRVAFADVRHHSATTALLVILFWLGAAALVGTAQVELVPVSANLGASAAIAAVFVAAWSYTRLCARNAEVSHALGVGVAWLLLATAAEMVVTARLGHPWNLLLGSPQRPLLRNVFLFVWVFAPAFFARREVAE